MTGFGAFVAAAARRGELVVQPRMGFGDAARMRAGLVATRDAGVCAAGTITVDSFTRTGDHGSVRAALAEDRRLNGYPIVDHPAPATREVLAGVSGPGFPVQVRHGSARPQRIMAALAAAGLDATEGGPVSYCLPYSRVPVADAVRAWTEAVRVFAGQREFGRPHLETFGGCMMGQLCPPALLVAISVLEGVFFRRLGVDSVSLSYAQQTHPGQDLEALLALRALAGEFLPATDWHVVVYTYMGSFPRTPAGALALVADAARLCVRGGAERLIVKTAAEAYRIPTIEENVTALRVASAAAAAEHREEAAALEDTGIAAQARAIVEAVLDLGSDVGAALARAVRTGLLDVPYCLHPDNAGRTSATVDGTGRLRWTRTGGLPLHGLADAGGEPNTAERLLHALSYMERKFDALALDHHSGLDAGRNMLPRQLSAVDAAAVPVVRCVTSGGATAFSPRGTESGMSDEPDLDEVIGRYTVGSFTDSTLLTEAGVVSLSIFRIIAALHPDPDVEIDIESVAGVRTVADLKQWLARHLADAGRAVR